MLVPPPVVRLGALQPLQDELPLAEYFLSFPQLLQAPELENVPASHLVFPAVPSQLYPAGQSAHVFASSLSLFAAQVLHDDWPCASWYAFAPVQSEHVVESFVAYVPVFWVWGVAGRRGRNGCSESQFTRT